MAEKTEELRSRLARGVPVEGVQQTALRDLQAFCRQYNVNPANFMANAQLLRSGWQQAAGGDWSRFINWDRFNGLIAQNLTAARTGLQRNNFNQALRSELSRQQPASAPTTQQGAQAGTEASRQQQAQQLQSSGPSGPVQRASAVPAPARTERYVYNVEIGVLDNETHYTMVSPVPVSNDEELIRILRNPPEGFSLARVEGRRSTPIPAEGLPAIADQAALHTNDPLGVVWIERARQEQRPRGRSKS